MQVYILHSDKLIRYYVGVTTCVRTRLKQHLRGSSHWTSRADDWRLIHVIEAPDAARAYQLEKQIKRQGAGRYLARQLPNPAKAGQG